MNTESGDSSTTQDVVKERERKVKERQRSYGHTLEERMKLKAICPKEKWIWSAAELEDNQTPKPDGLPQHLDAINLEVEQWQIYEALNAIEMY